ncbi:MAG: DUF4350 domain-containing protein [Woeseiaceae bacterium]
MRDRLTTLAGALLALAVVYGLFFASDEPLPTVTRPLTTEKGANGYYALHQWLVGEHVNTYSLRARFSSLAGNSGIAEETGNILVTTLPYFRPVRESESGFLFDWVASGNTLLVLAALNDTPDWSLTATAPLLDDLRTITGTNFVALLEDEAAPDPAAEDGEEEFRLPISMFEDTGTEQDFDIVPRTGHPLMTGISAMKAESDFASSVWRAEVDQFELVFELASIEKTDTATIWQKQFGNGQIITVGSGTLLTNRVIAMADNRRFVANLVRQNLDNGATVIFDDLHQGLSSIYDPDAFFSDSRLHHTIYFILAFWLLYIVGSSNRLLDPQTGATPLRQTDFVEATAGFISRRMSASAVGLWMYRLWFNDLRRHMHLKQNGEPLWRELGALKSFDKRLLGKLESQYQRLSNEQDLTLIEVHNTIREARKAIG